MTKRKKITLTVFIACISLVIITMLVIHINNATAREVYDTDAFLSGEYVTYNYGEEAKLFFDSYADISEYKDIAFYHMDGEQLILLFPINKYLGRTVYMLDVYYEEERFYQITETTLADLGETELQENFINDWCEYEIAKNDYIYQNNNATMLFDEERQTIRYVFVCNFSKDEISSISSVVDWTFSNYDVKWNNDTVSNDYIFDYSK